MVGAVPYPLTEAEVLLAAQLRLRPQDLLEDTLVRGIAGATAISADPLPNDVATTLEAAAPGKESP